jgi:membrane protein YqaA with SNARE-associated domain
MIEHWVQVLLAWLALPQFGLSTVFVISFVSATLIPLGSEPVVFGMVKLRPDLFWPTIAVATVGNTLGGLLNYWIGYGVHQAWLTARSHAPESAETSDQTSEPTVHQTQPKAPRRVFVLLERFGPAACVLAWLPVVGDPLCSVAGWLKLSFWPCAAWMALGKFLRYVTLTAGMIWVL